MYHYQTTPAAGSVTPLRVYRLGKALTVREVLEGWAAGEGIFIDFYTELLLTEGAGGCFWEHPRLTPETLDEPYEVVITRTDTFLRYRPDYRRFANQFSTDEPVVIFPNPTATARLIAPHPERTGPHGRDLIDFLTHADRELRVIFWRAVGTETLRTTEQQPGRYPYLSTHGLGVLWLHVRLDERPKYYGFRPYRQLPE